MNPARRSYLRDVMALAWGLFRADPARTFADALTGAWRWTKARATRMDAAPSWAKAGRPVTVPLRSMLQSPICRTLTGPHANDRARSLGYVTSVMGR